MSNYLGLILTICFAFAWPRTLRFHRNGCITRARHFAVLWMSTMFFLRTLTEAYKSDTLFFVAIEEDGRGIPDMEWETVLFHQVSCRFV